MAIHAHLLTLELAILRLLAKLLTIDVSVLRLLAKLLTIDVPVLRLLAFELTRLNLLATVLTFDLAGLRLLHPVAAHLVAVHSRRPFGGHALDPFRTSLMSLRAHLNAFGALRPIERSHPLRPFHARRGHSLDSLRARRGAHLHPVSAGRLAVDALLNLRLSAAAPVPVGPRGGRGGDRQCGDTRGEKYPGHHNFSF